MTTASQARQAVRARIEGGAIVDSTSQAVPFRWQNEDADSTGQIELPDTPSPFVYVEFITDQSQLIGTGGGRFNNLYRSTARIDAYVFVPRGEGLNEAEFIAEQIASLFRSYRSSDISCFDASVFPGGEGADLKPPGLSSEVGNYFWALTEVSLYFDQIG